MTSLWMRHESRSTEARAPLAPVDAGRLVSHGHVVTVEESPSRVFPIDDYRAVGCAVAPAAGWPSAPEDCHILGLKELPPEPAELRHRHIYFGHAFKGQAGAKALQDRFVRGGGTLLDLEYLVDSDGRRLAAFGYWAGYVGAALAVLHFSGMSVGPLQASSQESLDSALRRVTARPRVLIVGALGRCGRGARDALAVAGISPTPWDVEETRVLDRPGLLGHDILVNAVATNRSVPPLLTVADVASDSRRLALVVDVTCDVASAFNLLPIYDSVTTWEVPVRRLAGGPAPLDLIAIDNLPSVLPREASMAFSAEMVGPLLNLDGEPWRRCAELFRSQGEQTDV